MRGTLPASALASAGLAACDAPRPSNRWRHDVLVRTSTPSFGMKTARSFLIIRPRTWASPRRAASTSPFSRRPMAAAMSCNESRVLGAEQELVDAHRRHVGSMASARARGMIVERDAEDVENRKGGNDISLRPKHVVAEAVAVAKVGKAMTIGA